MLFLSAWTSVPFQSGKCMHTIQLLAVAAKGRKQVSLAGSAFVFDPSVEPVELLVVFGFHGSYKLPTVELQSSGAT